MCPAFVLSARSARRVDEPPQLYLRRALHHRNDTPTSIALLLWDPECVALKFSYERWIGAEDPSRAAAYDAYATALDREQRAADRHARELAAQA